MSIMKKPHKTMSIHEEQQLLDAIANGDTNAKYILFNEYYAYVEKIVTYKYQHIDSEVKKDLVQEGSIGLWDAINKFDGTKKVKFKSYATTRINGQIIDYFRAKSSDVPIPYKTYQMIRKINDLNNESQLNGTPNYTTEELSILLSVSEKRIKKVLSQSYNISSLDMPISTSDEGSNYYISDTIANNIENLDEKIFNEEVISFVMNYLTLLEPRESLCIKLFLEGMTQVKIANILQVSESRVSQILKLIFDQIRNAVNKWEQNELNIDLAEVNKMKEICNLFPNKKEADVLEAFYNLTEKEQQVIDFCFNQGLAQTEIAIKIKKDRAEISRVKRQALKKMGEYLNSEPISMSSKRNIFKQFPDYSKSQVLEVIANLSERQRQVIEQYYGINGMKPKSIEKIAADLMSTPKVITSTLGNARTRIRILLKKSDQEITNNIQNKKTQISEPTEIVEIESKVNNFSVGNGLPTEKKQQEVLIPIFSDQDYLSLEIQRDQIKLLIGMLQDSTEQVVLLLKFGFVNNKVYNIKQIATALEMEEIEIYNIMKQAINNITMISQLNLTGINAIRQVLSTEQIIVK